MLPIHILIVFFMLSNKTSSGTLMVFVFRCHQSSFRSIKRHVLLLQNAFSTISSCVHYAFPYYFAVAFRSRDVLPVFLLLVARLYSSATEPKVASKSSGILFRPFMKSISIPDSFRRVHKTEYYLNLELLKTLEFSFFTYRQFSCSCCANPGLLFRKRWLIIQLHAKGVCCFFIQL